MSYVDLITTGELQNAMSLSSRWGAGTLKRGTSLTEDNADPGGEARACLFDAWYITAGKWRRLSVAYTDRFFYSDSLSNEFWKSV